LQRQQTELTQIQEKLITGKRINKPSDDPAGAFQVQLLDQNLRQIDQFKRNGDNALGQLQLQETVLSSGVDILQRTRELALQMANGTFNATQRQQAAVEVEQLMQSMQVQMQTKNSQGQFLFSGNNVTEQPFVEDAVNPGFLVYIGNIDPTDPNARPEASIANRTVQISFDPNDTVSPDPNKNPARIRLGEVGSEVFGAGFANEFKSTANRAVDSNIYNVMAVMVEQLRAGEAPSDDVIDDLKLGIDQIAANISSIGVRTNRIEAAADMGEDYKIALQLRRSVLEDQDLGKGITQLTLSQAALEVAQQTFVRVQQLNLFNFINPR
jgi:flagellar hook-associated protein 3 FlgL